MGFSKGMSLKVLLFCLLWTKDLARSHFYSTKIINGHRGNHPFEGEEVEVEGERSSGSEDRAFPGDF